MALDGLKMGFKRLKTCEFGWNLGESGEIAKNRSKWFECECKTNKTGEDWRLNLLNDCLMRMCVHINATSRNRGKWAQKGKLSFIFTLLFYTVSGTIETNHLITKYLYFLYNNRFIWQNGSLIYTFENTDLYFWEQNAPRLTHLWGFEDKIPSSWYRQKRPSNIIYLPSKSSNNSYYDRNIT